MEPFTAKQLKEWAEQRRVQAHVSGGRADPALCTCSQRSCLKAQAVADALGRGTDLSASQRQELADWVLARRTTTHCRDGRADAARCRCSSHSCLKAQAVADLLTEREAYEGGDATGADPRSSMDLIGRATEEVRAVLVEAARSGKLTTYGELARRVRALPVDPHSPLLSELLARVTLAEYQDDRPLLTSIVTRREGEPGKGLFNLAKRLGYQVEDPIQFWVTQLEEVFAFYGGRSPSRPRRSPTPAPARRSRRRGEEFTVDELLEFFSL